MTGDSSLRASEAIQTGPACAKLDCFVAGAPRNDDTSPSIEQYAGDDEHRRHRQHMCERFRGRPLGGFLHAGFLPKPGRDSSWREDALRSSEFLLGTPRDDGPPRFVVPTRRISTVPVSNGIEAAI